MSKLSFNFAASGRKLFDSEKGVVNSFAAKYARDTDQLSDQAAQDLMMSERERIIKSLQKRGLTPHTVLKVEQASKRKHASVQVAANEPPQVIKVGGSSMKSKKA